MLLQWHDPAALLTMCKGTILVSLYFIADYSGDAPRQIKSQLFFILAFEFQNVKQIHVY